jgi:hypothetical protein
MFRRPVRHTHSEVKEGVIVMDKMVIDITDGTVRDVAESAIVDIDTLDSEGFALLSEWCATGEKSVVLELAKTPLKKFTDNDLTHSNSLSFSVKALRDEINERINCDYVQKEYQVAKDFTDDQLRDLGQYILSSDLLWTAYTEELLSGIRNYANDILGREI